MNIYWNLEYRILKVILILFLKSNYADGLYNNN